MVELSKRNRKIRIERIEYNFLQNLIHLYENNRIEISTLIKNEYNLLNKKSI